MVKLYKGYTHLINARQSHCEGGGGEVFESQLETILVETQRRFRVVLDAAPEEFRHGPVGLVPEILV